MLCLIRFCFATIRKHITANTINYGSKQRLHILLFLQIIRIATLRHQSVFVLALLGGVQKQLHVHLIKLTFF